MFYYYIFVVPFLISILDFLPNVNPIIKKRLFHLLIIFFIMLKGLRWDTGTDFSQFYACFQDAQWDNIFSYWRYGVGTTKMEFGYVFLNVLIKSILPHYTFFLLITNALILCSFAYLINKFVPNYRLLALAFMLVVTEMYPVRQTLVTAIFCFSIYYAYTRQCAKYIVSILICFTIHRSSLFLLPIYWFVHINFKWWQFLVIYLGLIFSREILINYLPSLFNSSLLSLISLGLTDTYMYNDNIVEEYSIMTISNSIVHILLFSYIKHISTDSLKLKQYNMFFNLYFIYLCLNVIGSIPGLTILYRLSNNFAISYPICITFIIAILWNRWKRTVSIALCVGFWVIKLQSNPCMDVNGEYYKECFYPYYSVFETHGKLIRTTPWPFKN